MQDRRMIGGTVFVVLLMILGTVYYFIDPMEVRWMPRCIWKVATGTDCPGCGAQRMAHALMHGDFSTALHANAYAFCMLPLIVGLVWLEFSREKHPRLYSLVHAPAVIWALGMSVLVWWVVRNLV